MSTQPSPNDDQPGKPARTQAATLYIFAPEGSLHSDDQLDVEVPSPHEVAIAITACRTPFKVKVDQHEMTLQAMAATHHLPRKTEARGTQHLTFRVSPPSGMFRTLSACGFLPLDREMFADLDDALRQASAGQLSHAQAHALHATVVQRVAALLPPAPPPDERVQRVMVLINRDPGRTLESLAQEVGLSASRLSHLFTHNLGMSLRSFQTWHRLGMAWLHFISGEALSLTEIAQRAGFTDSSHFARTFHRFGGYTPTQARDAGFVRVIAR